MAEPVCFPGETPDCRARRDELLHAEAELRRRLEEVAALRRRLPLGGAVPQDYEFEEGAADLADERTAHRTPLSALFAREDASLIVYNFMYGPAMERPCPMCTSMLDGLNATAPHAMQRVNLAVVAKSPIGRIRAFARERGWRHLRLLSSANNTYNRDYHGETPDGAQNPMLNVFVRRDGAIRHFYASELFFAPWDAGQHPRHLDLIWPLWSLFDLTPEGRGTDWLPKIGYAP